MAHRSDAATESTQCAGADAGLETGTVIKARHSGNHSDKRGLRGCSDWRADGRAGRQALDSHEHRAKGQGEVKNRVDI